MPAPEKPGAAPARGCMLPVSRFPIMRADSKRAGPSIVPVVAVQFSRFVPSGPPAAVPGPGVGRAVP